MSSQRQIDVIEAEVTHYRDSIALLRARLYRQGAASSPRLEELERRLDSAELRLRVARPATPPATPPAPLP